MERPVLYDTLTTRRTTKTIAKKRREFDRVHCVRKLSGRSDTAKAEHPHAMLTCIAYGRSILHVCMYKARRLPLHKVVAAKASRFGCRIHETKYTPSYDVWSFSESWTKSASGLTFRLLSSAQRLLQSWQRSRRLPPRQHRRHDTRCPRTRNNEGPQASDEGSERVIKIDTVFWEPISHRRRRRDERVKILYPI